MIAHRVRLVPTEAQEMQMRQACGVARFAYNWALAQWRDQYKAGGKPSEGSLRKQLNGIKAEQFPWMADVTKNAPQQGIKNLGRAYTNFFSDLKKYKRKEIPWKRVRVPKFKKTPLAPGARPMCIETGSVAASCSAIALGEWPLPFWRFRPRKKTWSKGKLRAQLWWHIM